MIEIKIVSAALPAARGLLTRTALFTMAGIIPVYSVTADWLTETIQKQQDES